MQREAVQCSMQRLVTGARCEVQGCYELALWLVVWGSKTDHLCANHTRGTMEDGPTKAAVQSLADLT